MKVLFELLVSPILEVGQARDDRNDDLWTFQVPHGRHKSRHVAQLLVDFKRGRVALQLFQLEVQIQTSLFKTKSKMDSLDVEVRLKKKGEKVKTYVLVLNDSVRTL